MRGPVDVDLSTQPPPDLAIEVEVTHRADDSDRGLGPARRPRGLAVRTWTARRSSSAVRQADGTYAPVPRSLAFPELEPADVLSQLRLAAELGSSRWSAQLDDWVRDVLLPRRGRM